MKDHSEGISSSKPQTINIKQIRAESNICLFSCVTNFITSSTGSSNVSLRVEPILMDFLAKVESLQTSRPDVRCLVCPPMYREAPIWYRDSLPQILKKFSDVFSQSSEVLILPSFATPDFESDGVHLTAYSGSFDALVICLCAFITIFVLIGLSSLVPQLLVIF